MLFVNMPVADLERSKAFFAKLGFSYHPGFTDETAACMLVGEHAFVMLLSREKFAEFAKLPIRPRPRTTRLTPRGRLSQAGPADLNGGSRRATWHVTGGLTCPGDV